MVLQLPGRPKAESDRKLKEIFVLYLQQRCTPGQFPWSLLYNLYVADIPCLATQLKVKLPSFADDMTLYCSHTSIETACARASTALTKIASELQYRGLSANPSKTVAMLLYPSTNRQSGQDRQHAVLLGNSPVEQVHNAKLLGVIVDDRLAWTEHVNTVCRKVGRKIGVLRRTFRQLTPKARRQF